MKTRYKRMNLITYGLGDFNPRAFNPVVNSDFIKPKGGLWSSPVETEYGWFDWCRAEDFGKLDTSFTFWFEGNIYVIDSLKDAEIMPWASPEILGGFVSYPDFERMVADGVDAIHLTVKGERLTRFSHPLNLYGWDCECVFVMNPKCITLDERVKA